MNRNIKLLLLIATMIGLSGCDSSKSVLNTTQSELSDGYTAPLQDVIPTAYPSNMIPETKSDDIQIITQDPSLGSVKGILLLNGKPITNVTIYVGNLITDDMGRELVAGYDRTSVMRASPNDEGVFIIYNVPEGRYGLILDFITHAYLLDMPDGSQSVLFSVQRGEVTDIGLLDYNELPGILISE